MHDNTFSHDEGLSQRFLRRFGITVGAALALIVAANYIVNPLDLYPWHVFEPMVRSSRVTKVRMLSENSGPGPEAVVIGSSRAMEIAPALLTRLTGLRAFNFATDSARAEDYYANVRWLVEDRGVKPQVLIIGADVEAFHNHAVSDERLLAIPALAKYLRHGEVSQGWADRLRRLVSKQQTQMTALSLIRAAWRGGLHITGVRRGSDPIHSHFEADGYLRYDDWELARTMGRFNVDQQIEGSVSEYRGRFANFTALSETRKDDFIATLAYAKSKHITTIVFLTPLHATVIRALEPIGYADRLREVTAFLTESTRAVGAAFLDFSTIDAFGGDPRAFWDGGHADAANCDRMTRRLVEAYRAVQ